MMLYLKGVALAFLITLFVYFIIERDTRDISIRDLIKETKDELTYGQLGSFTLFVLFSWFTVLMGALIVVLSIFEKIENVKVFK